MSTLQISGPAAGASIMVKRGFKVFPLMPGTKDPYLTAECSGRLLRLAGGIHRATSSLAIIEGWLKIEPNLNFGISTHDIVVLDTDMKGDKNGRKDLDALGGAPTTFTVETGTGGKHLYFEGPPTGQAKLAHGVDTRSLGGYVVAPGSVFDGKQYRLKLDVPVAKLPGAWREKIGEGFQRDNAAASTPVIDLDIESNLKRARDYLETEAPIASEGNRGYTAYKVAAVLGDRGVSEEAALDLMRSWNERCQPPQSEEKLEEAVRNSYRYRRRPPGSASPIFDFRDILAEFMREHEPLDLFGTASLTKPPTLTRGMLPPVIANFSFDQAERTGVEPAMVAIPALTTAAAALTDAMQIQHLEHDNTWKESARLWTAVVAPPGTSKTPFRERSRR
jgi:bifunctional DNA primase/polymerase-like protein/uncharacterized protein DUF3987